ncbi:MAG: protein kinase [Coriobacteriales bacterium]|jgi:hypothetical protein|nr:protein kinase [Coriobacteriales bacterium]
MLDKNGHTDGGNGNGSAACLGPYELRGELGRGAMARVWRAWDPKLGREVAIKEPLFDERLSGDVLAEMGERFVREGMAAARLNHPGIVTIFAADVYDGRPAIVMELVDGVTLGDLLEAGPLAPRAALDALDQLLDAAGYAHSQGVVHRDIKPDNVFVTRDGRVKLGDFGIAHVEDSSLTKRTQVGTVLGTPGYMAPEQAMGAAVDNRTDLFSVGTIAYEMLTGRNPFGADEGTDSTTLLYRIVHEPPPALPAYATEGLPADVRPAVLAALNKNPADRPQSAASFKAMLHGAPAPAPGAAAQASPLAQAASSGNRRWLPYALAALVGVAVLGAVFLLATSGGGGGGMVVGGGVVTEQVADPTVGEVEEPEEPEPAPEEPPEEEPPEGFVIDMGAIDAAISAVTSSDHVAVGIIDLEYDQTFLSGNAQSRFEASGFYLPIVNVAAASGIGTSSEIPNVLRTMSNNDANNLIGMIGGFSELNRRIADAGLNGTSYNRLFGDTGSSEENLTTAADAVKSLQAVYRDGGYTAMQADLTAIGVQPPSGVSVNAHSGIGIKTAVNVFAVVSTPDATYAVAVLTTGMGGSSEAAKAAAAPLISTLLSLINSQVESYAK